MNHGMPPLDLDLPIDETLTRVASALRRPVQQLVVCVLKRPRHDGLIQRIRHCGAALRLITDGDITAALGPSMPGSGIDLYVGIGGATEAVLTAAALKTLGGGMLARMWPRDASERVSLLSECGEAELKRTLSIEDLVSGPSAIFCATGISDSPLLPGIKIEDGRMVTSSILLRASSRTVRHMRTVHDLNHKQVRVRGVSSISPAPHRHDLNLQPAP